MKLCIPIMEDHGLKSVISDHFGGAPFFMIVDTENNGPQTIKNENEHHAHGMCQPIKSLSGYEIDAVVCSGIGAGALNKLNASGIKVFKSSRGKVEDLLTAFNQGGLPEFTPGTTCSHHGNH